MSASRSIQTSALIAMLIIGCGGGAAVAPPVERGGEPPGVQTFQITSSEHVEGTVDYPQNPPMGGPHNPVWQNCGFYDQPVSQEMAVHSMEHGAVWITYTPELPSDQVAILRALATRPYVLVTPYQDLPAPVVASAWGKQLQADGAADPRLEAFIERFANGPQTPEPGAPCDGGAGTPQ